MRVGGRGEGSIRDVERWVAPLEWICKCVRVSGRCVSTGDRLAYGAPVRDVERRLEVGRGTRCAAFGDLLSCSRDMEWLAAGTTAKDTILRVVEMTTNVIG